MEQDKVNVRQAGAAVVRHGGEHRLRAHTVRRELRELQRRRRQVEQWSEWSSKARALFGLLEGCQNTADEMYQAERMP